MKILVDPGHGGKFPGACANGLRECDLTLAQALLLVTVLKQRRHEVHMTRDGDNNLSDERGADLAERCRIANLWRPDLIVSLHCNAALADTARGFEVWTSPGQTLSDHAAERIVTAFNKAFPTRLIRRDMSDGDQDKESKFTVLVDTDDPAVLVEIGFLSNAEEAGWVANNRNGIAMALADGVDAYDRWLKS